MSEAAARNQHAGIGQGFDDRIVGVALFALVGKDARAGKSGRLLGEAAVGIDGVRNGRVDAAFGELHSVRGPHVEVLAAVPRRGMNEARAGVLGDVIGGKKRHRKFVVSGKSFQRMRAERIC